MSTNPIFQRPEGVRFVDMAIEIDKTLGTEEWDPNKAFSYMYHLAYMLASKAKYFYNIDDYDGFACYLAYSTYQRLTDPDKIKIKSVLNYMKSIIGFRRMAYQQETYCEIIDPLYNCEWNDTLYREKSIYQLETYTNEELHRDVKEVLESVPRVIRKSIPKNYKRGTKEYRNIYISVMLTLLNSMTLPDSKQTFLENKTKVASKFNDINYYRKHVDDNTILLWGLPENMKSVVQFTVNKVKHAVSDDIKDTANEYKITEEMFSDLSNNEIFGEVYD